MLATLNIVNFREMRIKLIGGSVDGGSVEVSDNALAVKCGDVAYVWDGSCIKDRFVAGVEYLKRTASDREFENERMLVGMWMRGGRKNEVPGVPSLIGRGMPWWRFNAWVACIESGELRV